MIKANIKLTFTEELLGSAPLDHEVYTKYIETLKVKRKSMVEGEASDVEAEALPDVDRKGTGFHRIPVGFPNAGDLFIYDYAIKGFFKEVGNILKVTQDQKALRSKIDNYLFVNPRRIQIMGLSGAPLRAPDRILERPLRAMTAQGPRVSLAMSELVNPGSSISFQIKIIDGSPITHPERLIESCLEYGRDCKGFGQWRNGGYGRFDFKLEFDK